MGWLLVICCIPLVPLLFAEFAVPRIRRALARPPELHASAEGPYRDSPAPAEPAATHTYAEAWARYRRLRTILFSLLFGWIPATVLLNSFLNSLTGIHRADAVLGIGWWFSFVVFAIRGSLFRCPRCGNRFQARGSPKGCYSCGLALYALSDESK